MSPEIGNTTFPDKPLKWNHHKHIHSCVQILFPLLTGVYEVSCIVTDHYSGGMRQRYRVNLCPWHKVKRTRTEPTKIVQYFISAEEIEWDYSPERHWELEKHHTTSEDRCVRKIIAGWCISDLWLQPVFTGVNLLLFANGFKLVHVSQSRQYICGAREKQNWLSL